MPSGCCVASRRAAVSSSRRPLTAPPSRRLAPTGCCVASHCAALSSSRRAALSSSRCAPASCCVASIKRCHRHRTPPPPPPLQAVFIVHRRQRRHRRRHLRCRTLHPRALTKKEASAPPPLVYQREHHREHVYKSSLTYLRYLKFSDYQVTFSRSSTVGFTKKKDIIQIRIPTYYEFISSILAILKRPIGSKHPTRSILGRLGWRGIIMPSKSNR